MREVSALPAKDKLVRLPPRPTRLIGREAEVAALQDLLLRDDVRLVTISGPPGVGKTRLAVEVADRLTGQFPNGVVFVDLSTIRHAKLVPYQIARALGIRAEAIEEDGIPQDISRRIATFLEDQRLLLLTDNFEHVLEAASFVGDLLSTIPSFKVLATSRAPLHLLWEQEFALAPLPLPEFRQQDITVIAGVPAVELFLSRARSVAPQMVLDAESIEAVVQICRRLDGLPLAIELAAARSRMLPLTLLEEQLARGLDDLPGVPKDLPERQRTLHRALAWSYDLLNSVEKAVFRHLSVFAGGFTLEAIQAVWAGDQSALPILAGLADQHLIQPVAERQRYRMLGSIREFALARLEEAGEKNQAYDRYARYFMHLAEDAQPALRGPNQMPWMARLDGEQQNLFATLHWCLDTGEQEIGLRLASGLSRFWDLRAPVTGWQLMGRLLHLDPSATARVRGIAGILALFTTDRAPLSGLAKTPAEAVERLKEYMEFLDPREDEIWHRSAILPLVRWQLIGALIDYARAQELLKDQLTYARSTGNRELERQTLSTIGFAAATQVKSREAVEAYTQALTVSQQLGDLVSQASTLEALGWQSRFTGDFDRAARFAEEALKISTALGWQWNTRRCITNLGAVAYARHDLPRAEALFEERLRLEKEAGDPSGLARALNNLAIVIRKRGDHTRARHIAEDSVQRFFALDQRREAANALLNLGVVLLVMGDVRGAAGRFRHALLLCREFGLKLRTVEVLEATARVARRRGDLLNAARLLGAVNTLSGELEGSDWDVDPADFIAQVRREVGPEVFEAAKSDGAGWLVEHATEVALGILEHATKGDGNTGDIKPQPLEILSPREREVAALVAQGLSNREIGRRLFISERTADTHVQNILNKLGFNTRAQIAAWVGAGQAQKGVN